MRTPLPVFVIVLTVVLDAMGIGLIIPVLPELIQEVTGRDLSHAAAWGGLLETAFAVMQFLCAPLLGALSDARGRRPILLISMLAMGLMHGLTALAGTVWLLLLARLLGGAASATHAAAMAYMTDISTRQQKAARFGLISAGFGLGLVLGPVTGGLLAEWGTRAPFWAAAALSLANAALGWHVLRETLPQDKRRSFGWHRANPLAAFRDVARIEGAGHLLLVIFLYSVAMAVYPAIWPFFTAERFDWGPSTIGLSLAIYGLSAALVQGVLVGPVVRIMGEQRTAALGLTFEIGCLITLGFITSGPLLLMLIPVLGLAGLGLPALQGMTSGQVSDDMQGALQGVQTSLGSLSMALTPIVVTQIFARFTRDGAEPYLPGAPFLFSALLMGLALAVFLTARRPR